MTRIRAYVTATLTLALLCAAPMSAFAATKAQADQHANAAASAREKAAQQQKLAEQLKGQTAQLDAKVDALQADADALDGKISSASKQADGLTAQVTAIRSRIAVATAEIAVTQAQVAREQGLLAERVTSSYKQGEWWSYVDILLGAHDISDLIARTELVNRVMRANSDTAEQLSASKRTLDRQKAGLDQNLAEMNAKLREAASVEASLKGLQAERQGKADAQQSVLDQKTNLLADTQQNAKRLLAIANAEEAESARIRAELARAKKGSGAYHGSMAWPVPGHYTITSPFGYRMHPILHKRVFHAGIDIAGGGVNGAAIVAAGSGTVIETGPRGGYGNVVMIDHGNGVVTIYAHQQSGGIKVHVGQHVTKGQRIGTVGSTGMSTGPHCHFEVRVNGSAVDPQRYL